MRICSLLPVPRLALLISQRSVLTQTTHRIVVSQFKNRLSGTILAFPAVYRLHIGSLFQALFPPIFSLSLPPLLSPLQRGRMSARAWANNPVVQPAQDSGTRTCTRPRTAGPGRQPPRSCPSTAVAQGAPAASFPTTTQHCKRWLQKIQPKPLAE